jgi:hypothetical protein
MRNITYFVLLISLSFISCNKDSNPVDDDNDGSLIISGTINDYKGGYNKVYTFYHSTSDTLKIIDSEITLDGSFNLRIPPLSDNHLSSYLPTNRIFVVNGDSSIVIDSIHIADNNLKYVRCDLMAKSDGRVSFSLPLNLAKLNNPYQLGDYFVSYYYFNSQTRIQGYHKWRVVTQNASREIITEFNINTKKGWNKVYTKYKSESYNKSIYEVSEITTDRGDWIIGASDAFSNALWKF